MNIVPACPRPQRRGFTLTELLVVIGIIALLAALLMPALAGAKRKANQIKCLSNLRQVNLALQLYADDHNGEYPPRREPTNAWPWRLLSYYRDIAVMACPSDSFPLVSGLLTPADKLMVRRSYVINGFNDYFRAALSPEDYRKFDQWQWPAGMKESNIPQPSETITLGEKRRGSYHVHMDFSQGEAGNDVEEIEENQHRGGGGAQSRAGGSNFAFADGHVSLLKYGQSRNPVNLWAVRDEWRNVPVRQP
jgi:prepilin-type N-terminal cleavage/methylation domain-containing protein/prepilin-type processing-associated H-X9-DG protein